MIVKLPSRVLQVATLLFHDAITESAAAMGIARLFDPIGSATCEDRPYMKEPDASYIPVNLQGRSDKWPTVVVESGFLKTIRRLRVDAEWWLVRSAGDVKVVIIIAVKRDEPEIIIENWIADGNGPTCQQEIVISRTGQVITVLGAPLTITHEELLLQLN
ncbi:uncharacterized protein ASPGLDRAFT_152353, partial [Aspergillus glaucus CBS 516.65]